MSEKILIVDDEKNVLEGYKRALHGHFSFDMASSAYEALQLVETEGPYAVVLADMQMPEMSGMELLAALKDMAPDTVRVMVTGNADQQTAVDAVNKGQVYQFLNKPCMREQLIEAIGNALNFHGELLESHKRLDRSKASITELTEQLQYKVNHDYLTGLYNRHAFEHQLRQCLEESQQRGTEHGLCYLDLEHFHVVNDTCGHLAGDAMLRTIGDLLSSKCRLSDLVGRMVGDEFGILLIDCPLHRATRIIEDIKASLEQMGFEWNGKKLDIQITAGLVPVTDSVDATLLLNSAETACHVAKEQGSWLHVAGPEDASLAERLSQAHWVTRIGNALREHRFRLFGQLIVPIGSSEEGDHFEVLLRMLDEEGELLSPEAFLPAAERFHLSNQIDRWVISATIDWLGNNPDSLQRLALCSINLSGLSVGKPDMLDFIQQVFTASSVPPEKICFEITETVAITQMSSAVNFINDLRQMGFRFALDDFGSGLSSFGYLRNLPVDYVKIDGMFVRDIDSDEINRTMVRSIHEVARVMGKQTIAEYVENANILELLADIGVDFAQGYHIAKPCPLDELPVIAEFSQTEH